MEQEKRSMKEVFQIIERKGKTVSWIKIGVAFVNKDDSLNLYLDSLPLNGKLHVRERRTNNKKGEQYEKVN